MVARRTKVSKQKLIRSTAIQEVNHEINGQRFIDQVCLVLLLRTNQVGHLRGPKRQEYGGLDSTKWFAKVQRLFCHQPANSLSRIKLHVDILYKQPGQIVGIIGRAAIQPSFKACSG